MAFLPSPSVPRDVCCFADSNVLSGCLLQSPGWGWGPKKPTWMLRVLALVIKMSVCSRSLCTLSWVRIRKEKRRY